MVANLPRKPGRCVTAACAALLISAFVTNVGDAQMPGALTYEIAPQPVAQALAAFAMQTGLQLVYLSEIDTDQQSRGSPAGLAPQAALSRLLAGTGLQFEFLNARSVRIFAASARPRPPPKLPHAGRDAAGAGSALEQVIVSATRREMAASEVPISMSVWTQEAMAVSGIKDLTDLAVLTPGMYFSIYTGLGQGFESSLVLRGISDIGTEATTGIYLDDTPVHARTGATSWGDIVPVTFDVERVEVLRGPQGTLGGEAALGGAVHFITNKPSLTDWSGLAHTEVATTDRGAPSWEAGVALGGPIVADRLGFRMSAWSRLDGGYVDRVNPFTGAMSEADANHSQTRSLRAAVEWEPADTVRVTPAFMYQSKSLNDSPIFDTSRSNPSAGVLRNVDLLQQPYDDVFQLASVRVASQLEGADLSAITAYSHRRGITVLDIGPTPETYANLARLDNRILLQSLSQEIRFASPDATARFNWVAGLWFARTTEDSQNTFSAVHTPQVSSVLDDYARTTQIDGFGEIDLRTTRGLTTTLGARVGHAQTSGNFAYGPTNDPPPPSYSSTVDTTVLPRLVISRASDHYGLLYLSIARGYQLGGVNFPPNLPCLGSFSPSYGPDSVWNYELGAKRQLPGGRAQVEASLFHMAWRNIQQIISPFSCGPPQAVNAGSAASNGFDLSTTVAVSDHVRLSAALEYVDARYTSTVYFQDGTYVHDGDIVGNLPNIAPPWSGNISADADVLRTTRLAVRVHAEAVMRSHATGPFALNAPGTGQALKADPATSLVNARLRFLWSRYEATAYIDNVFDALPVLTAFPYTTGSSDSFATTFRPRTIGITASAGF